MKTTRVINSTITATVEVDDYERTIIHRMIQREIDLTHTLNDPPSALEVLERLLGLFELPFK